MSDDPWFPDGPELEQLGKDMREALAVDWGHGPNSPVPMWTEEQIRAVMDTHRPGNEGYCLCAWKLSRDGRLPHMKAGPEFTVDHLIEKLKEAHGG